MSDYRLPGRSARMDAPSRENRSMSQDGPTAENHTPQDQALTWLILLEDADEACRARFAEWLAVSPANAEAFRQAQSHWQSPLLVEAAARLETRRRTAAPARRRMRGLLAVAASLLLACGVIVQSDLLLRLKADHVTAVGQRQSLELADGSHVLLNTDTAISSRIDERQRVTHLYRGEAYFDVARDSGRPFEVKAGPVQVSVRGTAFAVRYLNDEAEVSVERGEVELHSPGDDTRVSLGSGDSIRVGRNGFGSRVNRASAPQLAWVQGRLVFDNRPLHEVLAELRRYYPGWIVSNNPHLNDLSVTGNYRLDNPLEVMRSLAQVTSARLHEYPALLILN
ncbi:glycerol-3-phosphate ABC transporter substrate-binding protein [Pseudomonas dryadis]|uniref:Glycerol-3-phosphate ABC transporter substrate-binding protein n=2 Tax=Pseudomonadales TaxID=72274 RepID=A0A4Q9QUL0_9GAMM|nr:MULTISPECIES: FecR domain-containing protein [Pseudomonas]TBU86879.1 glycerol-3-phosphate ABC transporter substrate-binding protein [Pseudomonas dryadis]TBV03322.1 glycerol-3-phosphate ABC transporter substrate-binding protein [Pseudomonas dryadis]TBV16303.1 glycerol-3-phosphate ABC transporter substrate-binding protein [Pseudomonas sp. FRB 230]